MIMDCNKDTFDIIKIVESLEKLSLLIDGAYETIRHTKKQEDGSLPALMVPVTSSKIAPLVASLIQPVVSSLINAIAGKGVRRAGKRKEGEIPPILIVSLLKTMTGKDITK